MQNGYRGRFAPSPTGLLHLGSAAAALASWLDARAHGGAWLVRIEDVDPPRDIPGADRRILSSLARLGMEPDEPVVWQSARSALYAQKLQFLAERGLAYGCACSRREQEEAAARAGLPKGVYPGTCRHGTGGRPARSVRFLTEGSGTVAFEDRLCGRFAQDVEHAVGDFVIRRADGLWAYQLAAVVDDAEQGITHIVRGADLLDNTPRQLLLQQALAFPHPAYMHIPLVTNREGEKLSKQTKAPAIDDKNPLQTLEAAWKHLGFAPIGASSVGAFLACAADVWRGRFAEPSA